MSLPESVGNINKSPSHTQVLDELPYMVRKGGEENKGERGREERMRKREEGRRGKEDRKEKVR